MEERLKTYLRPGEQVRWQGRPAPFSLLEAEAKKQWGLTVALGGGLLAVYLSGTEAPSMGFIGLVLLVAAVILISPVAERRNLMGEQYWITNQRAILMTRDKTFFYMELSDIDDLQIVGGRAWFWADACLRRPRSCSAGGPAIPRSTSRAMTRRTGPWG